MDGRKDKMEEKILLQSEQCRLGKFIKILLLLGLAISILVFAIFYTDNASAYDRYYRTYLEHKVAGSCGDAYASTGQYCYYCDEVRYRSSETDYALDEILDDVFSVAMCLLPIVSCLALSALVYFWLGRCELTVTDRRIYGRAVWGKKVDLPRSELSGMKKTWFLKGIKVSSAIGKFRFRLVKNAEALCVAVQEQPKSEVKNKQNSLVASQMPEKPGTAPTKAAKKTVKDKRLNPKGDAFKKMKKYKELLDLGIITQEEFEKKKKELLDL